MASYQKTPNGHWRVFVKHAGLRKTGTFDTKRQAENFAAEAMAMMVAEKAQQDNPLVGDITFRELLGKYKEEVTPDKRGSRWEKIRIEKLSRELLFIDWPVTRIRHWHIQEWVDKSSRSLAAGSVIRELNILSNVFTYACRWRYVTDSPTRLVIRPKADAPRDRRISDGEIEAILKAIKFNGEVVSSKDEVAVAFLFAIETAMRAGELLQMKPGRYDLDRRVARLEMTKNGRPREVPLSGRACELLSLLPTGQFTVSSATLSTLFRKYSRLAGVEGLTFHDTRHEAVTRLSKIFNVLELARVVGHSNPKQLMTYYNESAEDLAKRFQ